MWSVRAFTLFIYCDNRIVLKIEQKYAIRERFEDPDFVARFQTTILISAIVTAVAAANSQRAEKKIHRARGGAVKKKTR